MKKDSQKKTYSVALVGAGGIGKIWMRAFAKTPGAVVRYVVDIDEERAKEIAAAFPGCVAHTKWDEIVSHNDLDVVIVATPNKWLASISYAALQAGKHVLCEKPGGIHTDEVKKNVSFAAEKNIVYMVGFNHRYHAAFAEAKRLIVAGEIGKLLFIRARHGFGGRLGYEKEWRFQKDIAGGGELLDQGVHMIDLARWFLGDILDVKGFSENLYWGGNVEDNGFVLLRTPRRQVASIHVSWTNWEWIHSFEIFGTKGYLVVDGLDQRYGGPERLTVGRHDPQSGKFPEEHTVMYQDEKKEDSFVRELMAFLGVVRGETTEIPTGNDAYEVLKIVDRVYKES